MDRAPDAAESSRKKDREPDAAESSRKKDREPDAAESSRKKDREPDAAESSRKKDREPDAAESSRKKDREPDAAESSRKKDREPDAAKSSRKKDREPDAAESSRKKDEERRPIVIGKPFDVAEYAARYTCRTKIIRLRFIADRFPALELEALKIAYNEIKKAGDTASFMEVVAQINGRLGRRYRIDDKWADVVERRARRRKRELTRYLEDSKKNKNRERIWDAYNILGHFYYVHGNLPSAYENHVSKTRYYTTPKQIMDGCLDIILVCIEMGMFSTASFHAITAMTKRRLDPKTKSKLLCAAALANLEKREYRRAALKFLAVCPVIEDSYSEVISRQDIAIYGGVCALACFEREDIKRIVIDNIFFKWFFQWVPEVHDLLNNFYDGEYASFFERLGILKEYLYMDIHLYDHVDKLCEQIREKALIQYTLPLKCINLDDMAITFGTSVTGLEQELTALIANGQIRGDIDSQKHVLNVRPEHPMLRALQRPLHSLKEFFRAIKRNLNE